jgi:hypothetical protein
MYVSSSFSDSSGAFVAQVNVTPTQCVSFFVFVSEPVSPAPEAASEKVRFFMK